MPSTKTLLFVDTATRFSLSAVRLLQKGYLPQDNATRCYGFFCRQELKMDKVTVLPIRVRLGSVEQTDWLEGKVKSAYPQH